MEDVNRIKLVLVEKKRTNKWLSGQMGATPVIISKCCTNPPQPELRMLSLIANIPNVADKSYIAIRSSL